MIDADRGWAEYSATDIGTHFGQMIAQVVLDCTLALTQENANLNRELDQAQQRIAELERGD